MNAAVIGLLAVTVLLGACSDDPAPARRAQVVKLLPDTPPPPPPPPKPEDRPPPKPEDAPKPVDQPKPVDTPQQQVLKSDEAAGDGPGNGLAAGTVTRDYTDQPIGPAPMVGASAPADALGNRLAANAFATMTTRALNEFLARDREIRRLDYQVRVDLWLGDGGTLQRAELVGSSGDAQTDEALRVALERFPGVGVALPPRLPQPLRLRVTNRMMG
jgi:periplasmic protein TonB